MQKFRRPWPLLTTILILLCLLIGATLFPSPAVQSQDYLVPPRPNNGILNPLPMLVAQAQWIGRGRILASHSFWNEKHSAIESDYTLEVHYTIAGAELSRLTVRTSGGYLPEEKIGMVDSHTPTFADGEEVLLFLQPVGAVYQVVGRELGKYTIQDNHAWNDALPTPLSLADLTKSLEIELVSQGRLSTLPADWALQEAQEKVAAGFAPQDFVYLNLKWEVNSIKFKININTSQAGGSNGSVQDFRDAIVTAATTWSIVPNADFTYEVDGNTTIPEPTLNSKNEIMFVKRGANEIAGQGRLWYTENRIIKEADMWLNDDRLWDATGTPATNEVDLQSVALHEFGHWLGLGHDPDNVAVMYATLTLGTTKRTLTSNDLAGIAYIYPCTSASCQPSYTPTPTPTPTFTPTEVPTTTPTPTFSSTTPPGQVGTATPTATVSITPEPSLTPSPRSTSQSGESVYLPMVQK